MFDGFPLLSLTILKRFHRFKRDGTGEKLVREFPLLVVIVNRLVRLFSFADYYMIMKTLKGSTIEENEL